MSNNQKLNQLFGLIPSHCITFLENQELKTKVLIESSKGKQVSFQQHRFIYGFSSTQNKSLTFNPI